MQTLTGVFTLLKAESNEFVGKEGKLIQYRQATLLDKDGDIMKLPITTKVYEDLKDIKNSIGTGVLTIVSGFKEKPKVSLVEFRKK